MTIAAAEPGFRMESVTMAAEGETLPAVADNFESELLTKAPDDSLLFASAADLGATGVLDVLGATIIGMAMGMGDPSAMPDADTSAEDYIAEQYEAAESLIGINLQTELFQQLSWRVRGLAGGEPRSREHLRAVCLRCGRSGDRLQRVDATFLPDPGRDWRRDAAHDA